MTPRVFVVDTNVVVAALISGGADSLVARVLGAMLSGSLIYLLSPALLAEYRSVLLRPKSTKRHGWTEDEIDIVLAELSANAIWREPAGAATAPDPGDDHLWALLGDYPGSTLVTGDRLLLEAPPAGSVVITPSAWDRATPSPT